MASKNLNLWPLIFQTEFLKFQHIILNFSRYIQKVSIVKTIIKINQDQCKTHQILII